MIGNATAEISVQCACGAYTNSNCSTSGIVSYTYKIQPFFRLTSLMDHAQLD